MCNQKFSIFIYGFLLIALIATHINCNSIGESSYDPGQERYDYDNAIGQLQPAPCASHLGECMDRCNKQLHRPATDCDDGQVCWIQGIKIYYGDRQCVLVGGLCVHTSDCLEPTTKKGLCPSYSHLGVECCYELPLESQSCERSLGVCMDSCSSGIILSAVDCDNGKVCCAQE